MRRPAPRWLATVAPLFLACQEPEGVSEPTGALAVAEPVALIGVADGDPDYLFGRVAGVAADRDGIVYVADAIGSTVRAYEVDGTYAGTVGTEGDGPGEFRYLLGLDFDPSGRLHVRGAFRVSVFERSASSPFADSLVGTFQVPGGNPDRDVPGRAGADRFYAPTYFWEDFRRRGYFYLAYDARGAVTDTVFVPPFPDPESTGLANYRISEQGGRNVEGINRAPFEPRPSWDISDAGHVWFTPGDRYEIVEVTPTGDTVRTVVRDPAPRPVPVNEREDSAAAFRARIDSLPVPLDDVGGMSEMARRGDLPDVLPPILSLHVGEAGSIWVRRWPDAGRNEARFDVIDPTGERDRGVLVPVALETIPPPWLDGDRVVGVVRDARTGVQRVAVFRVPEV